MPPRPSLGPREPLTASLLFLAAGLLAVACGKDSSDGSAGAKATEGGARRGGSVELLNVSYDPTRELWTQMNAAFIPHYEKTSVPMVV